MEWPMNEGAYKMLKQIGKGGNGEVWKARWKEAKKDCAIKIVDFYIVPNVDVNLRAEIATLKKVSTDCREEYGTDGHPNIVQFYTGFWTPPRAPSHCWLVMELMAGSLQNVLIDIRERNRATWEMGFIKFEIAQIILFEIATGLQFLHSRKPKILHRDVKTGNIVLSSDGKVKLTDFGASKFLRENSRRYTCTGTYYWMAPEVYRNRDGKKKEEHNDRADIWSLGILVFELLTGNQPYGKIGDIPCEPEDKLPRLEGKFEKYKSAYPGLDEFVANCLQFDKDARPSSDYLVEEETFFDNLRKKTQAQLDGTIAHWFRQFDTSKESWWGHKWGCFKKGLRIKKDK